MVCEQPRVATPPKYKKCKIYTMGLKNMMQNYPKQQNMWRAVWGTWETHSWDDWEKLVARAFCLSTGKHLHWVVPMFFMQDKDKHGVWKHHFGTHSAILSAFAHAKFKEWRWQQYKEFLELLTVKDDDDSVQCNIATACSAGRHRSQAWAWVLWILGKYLEVVVEDVDHLSWWEQFVGKCARRGKKCDECAEHSSDNGKGELAKFFISEFKAVAST